MDKITKGILGTKLLETCGCDINSAIYAFVPNIGEDLSLSTHNLHNLSQILDSAIEIFTGNKTQVAKSSTYYIRLKKEHENFLKLFGDVCGLANHKEQIKISQNRTYAALSALSCLYFDTFTKPVQFFLPHSSACSGRWEFWDSIDFFAFKEKLQNKKFNFNFRAKIMKSKVWNTKLDLDSFPVIVQRRMIKEKLLDKKLNPASMIKAMIIKMGEMGRPFINYEAIDFSIRELFTYLGEKKYTRVDREMEFLKRLDKEIITIFRNDL
jgi:hypothetical protein